jgi:hypothetical protein
MNSKGYKHFPLSFILSYGIGRGKEDSNTIHNEVLDSIEEGENLFYFLTSLLLRRKTMLVSSISFFNEVSTKTQNYPHSWFHFLMRLKSENHAQKTLFYYVLQKDNALEGHHVKGQNSIMAS